tara:strand:- start:2018 stop:2818 length:801 start_codon:yes stop_codon:yes gene_type:complete
MTCFAHEGLEELKSIVKPRMRVIIDNDLGGDPDGLFQLTHHILSPSVEIRGIVASHMYEQGFVGSGTSEYAKEQAMKILQLLQLENSIPVYTDKNKSLEDVETAVDADGVKAIIKEAMRTDTDLPLYVVCGGNLTNIASAYLLEPKIAEKLTVVWIGGPEYEGLALPPPGYTALEYNLGMDIKAAQVVFNASNLKLWRVPRNVYRQPIMKDAELLTHVKDKGALGNQMMPVFTKPTFPGRNIRVYQQLDNRLLFGDFFAKLELLAR